MKLFVWLLILCPQAAIASEIRDATVTLSDGTRIHLLEAGQPSAAPAIVFIPGWTLPAFLWKEQMQRFSSDRLIRSAVSERLTARQFGAASQRFGFGGGAQSGQFGAGGVSGAGTSGHMVDTLRERIAQNLREHVAEDVREHLESLVKERFESTLRERLGDAVRAALAEQIALGGGFDAEQIAETVRDRIADPLCDHVVHGIRERLSEVLRERLTETVRNAVFQSVTGSETAAGGPMMGLH